MEKTFEGICVTVNEEGYLTEFGQWSREVAVCIAAEEGINNMTDDHWKVIGYLQEQHHASKPLSIRGIKKCGLFGIKEFYAWFPGGPLMSMFQ